MMVSKSWWVWLLVGVLCACGPGLSTQGGQDPRNPAGKPSPVPKILLVPEVSYADEAGLQVEFSVTGEGFVPSSRIQLNGEAVDTTLVSSTHLLARVASSRLPREGGTLSVFTPPPGGGLSMAFPVTALRPVVEAQEPVFVKDPAESCSTFLSGKNFLSTSIIQRVSGGVVPSSYGGFQRLWVHLSAEECATAKQFEVVVHNPGDVSSEPVKLVVANPRPWLDEVSPRRISTSGFVAGTGGPSAAGTTLTLRGRQLLRSSTQVRWNGVTLQTSNVHYGSISAVIPPELFPVSGRGEVTLYNPPPGGGLSEPLEVVIHDGPVLTEMMPGGCATYAGNFTVLVWGSGFRAPMTLYFGGNPLPTRVLGPNMLEAEVSASHVLLPGAAGITVHDGDGKVSNPLSFYISERRTPPVLTSVSPSMLAAGSGARTLMVEGAGFHPSSQVLWNGQPRSTAFVATNSLRVSLSAEDLQVAGTARLTVYTPGNGGGSSLPLLFHIDSRRDSPFIRVVEPSQVTAGSSSLEVKVVGVDFHPSSIIRWNGTALPTVYGGVLDQSSYLGVGNMLLTATVPAALLATPGTGEVTVYTPAPGGGVSNPRTIAVQAPEAWVLGSLSPAALEAGTPQVQLSVLDSTYGSPRFNPLTSRVRVGTREKVPLPSSTNYQLDVSLDALDLSTPGPLAVQVSAPGQLPSAPLYFDVLPRQKPHLSFIRPGVVSVEAWNRAQPGWLLVYGENFRAPSGTTPSEWTDTLLLWNDATLTLKPEATSSPGFSFGFGSVEFGREETRSAGSRRVRLSRPGAAMGEESLTALVNVTEERPVSSVWLLKPSGAPAGGPALHLSLFGEGFHPSSVAYWNGMPLTTWMEGSMLAATVPASALATPGDATVTVYTPGPGGGSSMPLLFHVTP
jgi:hypothetical protein